MADRMPEREALLAQLEGGGYLTDPRLEEAMLRVARHRFLPEASQDAAYEDHPVPVEHGQTVSAPHMVAMMTSALHLEPTHRVLEVGTGRGYHAAVLAHMVPDGELVTIEYVPELAELAKKNLAGLDNVRVLQRDGARGAPEFAPFDAIIVTCAIPDVPQNLIDQLRDGGLFMGPIGVTQCELRSGRKVDGRLQLEDLGPCLFVNAQGDLGSDDSVLRPAP